MQINADDTLLLQNCIKNFLTQSDETAIELIIRPECNQKCEYCYLKQYGHESYPNRATNEQIINNISMIIDYFIENNYLIKKLDLFAGDMFYDNLFFDIIPYIKKYYIHLNQNHQDFIKKHLNNKKKYKYSGLQIMIPCNMSFCKDDDKINKVRQICNDFLELGVKIFFSYSTDGIYATNIREHQNLDEEYFNKIFKFCEEMNWGIHPMISYESIDYVIDNYDWFKKKMKQFKLNNNSAIPCYLEVRNNGWTEESIKKYETFLIYHLNDIFHNFYNSNLDTLFNFYFREYDLNKNGIYERNTRAEGLGRFMTVSETHPPCGLGQMSITINIGDLTLVPCHRLAYPELRGGQFIVQNNKIINLQANEGMNAYLNLIMCNNNIKPKCIKCDYNPICMKGCLGAQYEIFADPFYPIPSVCNLLQHKFQTIIQYYHSIGLFHYIFNVEPKYPVNTLFKKLLLKQGYLEYNLYNNLGDFYG